MNASLDLHLTEDDIERIAAKVCERLEPVVDRVDRVPKAIDDEDPPLIYDRATLAKKLGVAVVTLDKMEKKGSVPRRKQICDRRVGWIRDEVVEHLKSLPPAVGGQPLPSDATKPGGLPSPGRRSGKGRRSR